MTGVAKTKILMGLIVMAMTICALPLFSAPAYAAGTITDDSGNTYTSIRSAVNTLNDGDSIVLTVTGQVPAYYSTAVCQITKNVNVTILPGSDDAKITGGINYSGGGKLTFGRAGEINVMSMDGQISIESGELELNPGLNMNPTGSGDACVWAGSSNESTPVNVKIDGCTFITSSTSTHNHAIHLLGSHAKAEYIRNSEMVNNKLRTDYSLFVDSGASINELSNTVIKGDRYALSVTVGSEINRIDNCDISASVTALSVNGKIGTISDSKITNIDSASASVGDATRYSAIRMRSNSTQETGIGSVSNCTITCNGTNQTCAGIQMIGQSGHEKIYINTIEDCKIISNLGGAGIYLTGSSRIGSLDAEEVTSEKSSAVTIMQNSMIEEIKGGIYTGQNNAVNNLGTLTKITGDPVFYGKTGYAVANESEQNKISVEPTLSTELQGNARYYGAQGDFEDPAADTYPAYTPKNIKYSMSTLTEAVSGISGVGFHYLTVNVEVKYDSNGGTGDMSDKTYTGEYRSDLTAAENGFTRNNYVFTGWNTKADGKGTAYKPGDTIDITEEKTTLYAQWEYRGSIEISFGILNPNYRIEGMRLRDIQSSYYYSVSWFLQQYYGGGAATLKDSNGQTVDSFTDEYQYTFDNLPPGEYDIVLDVLDQEPLCLNAGVHNGAPRSDIIIWSEDSDKLHITIPENGTGVIRRWVSLERKAFGFKTVTDVGTFNANPQGSEVPGAPSSDGKEYVYYAVRQGGNNWSFDNPGIDEKPYIPYVQSHIGIYYGESASLYKGMTGLQVPTLSAEEEAMGYEFKGWKLQGDDSGMIYSESEALAHTVRKHIVFEAVWEKNPEPPAPPTPIKYTITYELNGGEYNGSTDNITETYDAGTKISIHEAPTREGYTFLYWKGSEYQPGDEYTVTEDHTFTAQWKKVAETDDTADEDDTKKSVRTRDENNLTSLLVMLLASAGTLAAMGYRRRRN